MCAAGLLLFGLKTAEAQQETNSYERPQRKKPEGFAEWAGFIIVWFLFPFYENIRYFKYTANRREWWGTLGRMFLLMMALTFIGIYQAGTNAVLIVMGIILIPIILASIRRMHDLGKSWWWILIPFVNFVMCGFFPGKD
jgi:CDP-diglyceride synthetase